MNSSKCLTIKVFHCAAIFIPLIILALLTGCGPTVPKSDLMDYLQKSHPPGLELTDATYEVVPAQNGQQIPGGIPLSVKITATASEDLYSAPTDPADIKPVNDYINFCNKYTQWSNAMQFTHYAPEINQDQPKIDKVVPKFIHRDQVKGDTFSGYCNLVAEHQVDRWVFTFVNDVDWGSKKPGQPLAQFGANSVGANTPAGQLAVQKFADDETAIIQFQKQFTEKHAAETQPLLNAFKPWLTSGQEIEGVGIGAANTRFTFSNYDPATNRFRARCQDMTGDNSGDGFIVGDCMIIFADDRLNEGRVIAPGFINFVGPFDPTTGDLTLLWQPTSGRQPENHREILHTKTK